MARLSPPRHALHRHIRLLDLRKGDDSPLSTVFLRVLRAVCASPKLSTPRRHRSEPSATSQTPSPQCAATSLSLSPGACRDARVASRHDQKSCPNFGYDAVRLVSTIGKWHPRSSARREFIERSMTPGLRLVRHMVPPDNRARAFGEELQQ